MRLRVLIVTVALALPATLAAQSAAPDAVMQHLENANYGLCSRFGTLPFL